MALEVPPPGVGLITVRAAVPAVVRLAAGMMAVSDVAETKVVASAVPFHSTSDVATKPEPVTVRVVAAAPAWTEVGESDEMLGTGLLPEPPPELPPPPPQPMTAPIRATEAKERNLEAERRIFMQRLLKFEANQPPASQQQIRSALSSS
jgi:hypothetical protein